MKNYTLRTINSNDEVINETQVETNDNDIIILECPLGVTAENASHFHKFVGEALESNKPVITLGLGITMKVLKK